MLKQWKITLYSEYIVYKHHRSTKGHRLITLTLPIWIRATQDSKNVIVPNTLISLITPVCLGL